MRSELHKLAIAIKEQMEAFVINNEKFLNGNKAAGARARKATLALEKLGKEFRKESMK